MILGFCLENKGMEIKVCVKNYGMEIIGDGGEYLVGNWIGKVKIKFKVFYFLILILVVYQLSFCVRLSVGFYVLFMISGDFNGYVFDGYLRKGDFIGIKVEFKDGNIVFYDFLKDL